MLHMLNNCHLVSLISAFEDEHQISLIFEYVHRKLDTEVWSLNLETIERLKVDMTRLTVKLASSGILHSLWFDNVGLGPKNELKYFLGFNFKINQTVNKEVLAESYRKEI
jgi:hypothetical protein